MGLEEGVLLDPTQPLELAFHEPINDDTLKVKVVRFETDLEGNLLPDAEVFFQRFNALDSDDGGIGTLDQTHSVFEMVIDKTLPVGPTLAVVIEAGLLDSAGHAWNIPQILKFAYRFRCGEDGEERKPTVFPAHSTHFIMANVDKPLKNQLKLVLVLDVDQETGDFRGMFTSAIRDRTIDCAPHGVDCDTGLNGTKACRTLPTPACVVPAERMASPDEYPDFVFDDKLPTGYFFSGIGCIRDLEDGSSVLANAPRDVKTPSPPVTVRGIRFNLSFKKDTKGTLRSSGSFSASQVLLGTIESGAGVGTVLSVEVPPTAFPSVPAPPDEAR